MLAKFIFWTSLLFIFYTYIGYPALLFIWAKLFPKIINKSSPEEYPTVSILIAARNEETNIGPRIENLLAQNYPKDKFEIIIISDGSQDRTNEIVLKYTNPPKAKAPPVKLLALDNSKGKPNALNQGMSLAKGEIILFTDARQSFNRNVTKELVANFSDPTVGCVSGELLFVKDTTSNIHMEMGLYWTFEKTIRKLESTISSVVGATGAIYAIRKTLYRQLPPETLVDDVFTPMNIVLQGFRTIFESRACAYDIISQNAPQEWRRKVRTSAGNWQLITLNPRLFFPGQNPICWQFLSHKFFRLLCPFFFLILFLSSTVLNCIFYQLVTFSLVFFLLGGVIGWKFPRVQQLPMVKFFFFFTLLNCATVSGFWYWLKGDLNKVWVTNFQNGPNN